jgi:hypothetical protein
MGNVKFAGTAGTSFAASLFASFFMLLALMPSVARAGSCAPLTRAQVRCEFLALDRAGYNPSTSDESEYPENVQAAERRLAAARAQGLERRCDAKAP